MDEPELTYIQRCRKFIYSIEHFFPYILLTIPFIKGCTISLTGYSFYIETYFPSVFFGGNKINNIVWELTNALFPLGGMVGALFGTFLAPKFGRKPILIIFTLIGILGSFFFLISYLAVTFVCFSISRFLLGISSGALMNVGLILCSEQLRGKDAKRALKTPQLLISFGIFSSGLFSLKSIIGSRWILTISPLFTGQIIVLLIVLVLPESPLFLIQASKKDPGALQKARVAMLRLRPADWNISEELSKLKEILITQETTKKVTMLQLLINPDLYYPILLCSCIAAFQQISGIGVAIAYSSSIIKGIGFPYVDIANAIVLSVFFLGSIIFTPLTPIMGVKFSMILGHLLMFTSFALAYAFSFNTSLAIASLFFASIYYFGFQAGPGPNTWELFRSTFDIENRAAANGIFTSINWLSNLLATAFSLMITRWLKIHPLVFFAILNLIFGLIYFYFLVETKNKKPFQIIMDYKEKFK
ncbi:hypothetical protein HZS_2838 [Henneguya salminicola]|nr:hypothetical protein HZS_2838 [Henneguya salminicola]